MIAKLAMTSLIHPLNPQPQPPSPSPSPSPFSPLHQKLCNVRLNVVRVLRELINGMCSCRGPCLPLTTIHAESRKPKPTPSKLITFNTTIIGTRVLIALGSVKWFVV